MMTAGPKAANGDWPWLGHYPENVDWHAPIPVKPVYALLDDTAGRYPDYPAFDFMGKKWTYGELARLARDLLSSQRRAHRQDQRQQ